MAEDVTGTIDTGPFMMAASLTIEGTDFRTPVPAGGELTIGREGTCDMCISDTLASRLHARVMPDRMGYLVEDMKSRNGTQVNGVRISSPMRLRDGDVITIGKTNIRFSGGPPPQPAPDGHQILLSMTAGRQEFLGEGQSPDSIKSAGHRLAALYAVLEAVSNLEDEKEVGNVVLKQLFRLISAERGFILLQEPNGELNTLTALNRDGSRDNDVKISKTLIAHVIQKRVAIVTSDAFNDPRLSQSGDTPASVYIANIRSAVSAPLILKGRVLGVLQLIFNMPGALVPEDDVRLLGGVALQTAVAIESARMHRERKQMITELQHARSELESRVEHLRVLNEIERSLAEHEDVETFLSGIVGEATKLLNAGGGAILMSSGAGFRPIVVHSAGDKELALAMQGTAIGKAIIDTAMQSGTVQRTDPRKETLDNAADPVVSRIRSIIAVPFTTVGNNADGGRGVLELFNREKGAFTEADVELMGFLGSQITSAMRRKQLLVEKSKSERMSSLGAVAGSIMHDIRNPLMRIRGFAELSARPGVSPEALAKYSRNITTAVDRCSNMASEILRFVKGETSLALADVDAATFFEDVFLLLENDIQNAKLNLEKAVEYSGNLHIDADKLNRVIFNLSSNAIRVMQPGGTLTVSCKPVADRLEIRVADTGPGIPRELAGRLFQPFATFGNHGGTGLGLSIVKSIVENHGGTIALDETVERGACFVIKLPRS